VININSLIQWWDIIVKW